MKKICFFTIADEKNQSYAQMMKRSLVKFHPDIPLIIFGEKELSESGIPKPHIFYIATPFFAQKLMNQGYEAVIKIDADSLVLGSLDEVLSDDSFDIGCVLNWNRIDEKSYGPVNVWDILPPAYVNNGFVAIHSREFIDHWIMLCNRLNIQNYRFREQDMLNILYHYGNYKGKILDHSNNWYGLISKGLWPKAVMRDKDIVIPKSDDGYPEVDKILKIIHFAGGEGAAKMNYKAYFSDAVSMYLDTLVK